MGILDNKPDTPLGGDPLGGTRTSAGDFSDVKAGSSTSAPRTGSTAPRADFSDVSGGESSTAPSSSTGTTYTVKSGDSLSKIAKAHYGDASKWKRIYEANRNKIKNPDLIYPGQEFIIPEN